MSEEETLETESVRGREAEQLLRNPLLREALQRMEKHIDDRAMSTRDTDESACVKVIQAKQILAGIQREIYKIIEKGEVARIQLDEIEKRSGLKTVFRR